MTQATDVPSAATTPTTFGSALRDRATWLLFLLGLATGMPVAWGWYWISHWSGVAVADNQIHLSIWLWVTLTGISLVSIAALLLAPMMDRVHAPLFPRLGHRAAWVATMITASLVMIVFFAAATLLEPEFKLTKGAVLWVFVAVPVAALLVLAIDALRIELRPGSAQPLAFLAQFFGALIAARIYVNLQVEPRSFLATTTTIGALLFIGLVALLVFRVSETPRKPAAPPRKRRRALQPPFHRYGRR